MLQSNDWNIGFRGVTFTFGNPLYIDGVKRSRRRQLPMSSEEEIEARDWCLRQEYGSICDCMRLIGTCRCTQLRNTLTAPVLVLLMRRVSQTPATPIKCTIIWGSHPIRMGTDEEKFDDAIWPRQMKPTNGRYARRARRGLFARTVGMHGRRHIGHSQGALSAKLLSLSPHLLFSSQWWTRIFEVFDYRRMHISHIRGRGASVQVGEPYQPTGCAQREHTKRSSCATYQQPGVPIVQDR